MPRTVYNPTEMDHAAHAMTADADDLAAQLEQFWQTLVNEVYALPSAVPMGSSPNLDDYLAEMLRTLSRLVALRHVIATRVAKDAAAAGQHEEDSQRIFRRGRAQMYEPRWMTETAQAVRLARKGREAPWLELWG
jgi:hypothetical protein